MVICLTPSNDVAPLASNPFIYCERSKDCGQRDAEEDEAADDGEGVGPAEGVVQQVDQGRHEERADAGAGLRDALREGTLLLEVGRHHDDGRQVDQAETHTYKFGHEIVNHPVEPILCYANDIMTS